MGRRRYSEADLLAMIPLYLDGALDAAERAAVEAYWAEHPEVLAHFAASTRLIDLLDDAVTAPQVDASFTAEVMDRIAQTGRWQRSWQRLSLVPPLTVCRLGLELVLLVFLAVLLWQRPWAPGLSPVECRLLGDDTWAIGRPVAVRVMVTQRTTQRPLPNADVRLRLRHDRGRWTIFRARTNDQGTVDADLRVGETWRPGAYQLSAEAVHGRRRVVVWHRLTVVDRPAAAVLPAADRAPVGEALQALVAVQPPRAGPLTWRLTNRLGTGLAQGVALTDSAGLAAVEAPLAASLPPGPARLWVTAGGQTSSRPVRLDPPRSAGLRATVSLSEPVLTGGRVAGEVLVHLPPAEAVAGASVSVAYRAASPTRASGQTDLDGQFAFALPAPERPGRLELWVTATDRYGDVVRQSLPVTVLAAGPRVEVRPLGNLVVGLATPVRVQARSAGGRPLSGAFEVAVNGGASHPGRVTQGAATVLVTPRAGWNRLELRWADGSVQAWSLYAVPATGALQVLPERARVPVEAPFEVTVVSPGRSVAVYLDLIADGRTVLSRSLTLARRRGSLVLSAPPGVSGAAWLRAYARDAGRWRVGWARVVVDPVATALLTLAPDTAHPERVAVTAVGEGGQPLVTDLVVTATTHAGGPPPVAPAGTDPLPRFTLLASSTALARAQALESQRRFFQRSPLFGGLLGGLLFGAVLLWLYQLYTDPFEYVNHAERRLWGRVPQVHRRGAWAGFGALLVGLGLALGLSTGIYLAGRQARELMVAATRPALDNPVPATWATPAVGVVRAALAAGEAAPAVPAAAAPELTWRVRTDHAGRAVVELPRDRQAVWQVRAATVDGHATAQGQATVTVPGEVGVELGAPGELRLGDEVEVPVTITNPTSERLPLVVNAVPEPGLELTTAPTQRLVAPPSSRLEVRFGLRAAEFGRASLRVSVEGRRRTWTATAGLEVVTEARRTVRYTSGLVDNRAELRFTIPPGATGRAIEVVCQADPLATWDRALATAASQPVAHLMDALGVADAAALRCRLWREAGRLTADRAAEVMPATVRAYQGLLRYEAVDSRGPLGGFARQPGGPPQRGLTALTIQVLLRLDAETPIDGALVRRARVWLARQAAPAARPLDLLGPGPAVEAMVVAASVAADRAATLETVATGDVEALAVAAVAAGEGGELSGRLRSRLAALRKPRPEGAVWRVDHPTVAGSVERGATLETTALAVLAVAAGSGRSERDAAAEGAGYLRHQQLPDGTWGGAWVTAAVIRALAAVDPPGDVATGSLVCEINGETLARTTLTDARGELRWRGSPGSGPKLLRLRHSGRGRPAYEVRVAYARSGPSPAAGGLSLTVALDRTRVPVGGTVTARLRVRNAGVAQPTVVAAWPVPPGFRAVAAPGLELRDGVARVALPDLGGGQQREVRVALVAVSRGEVAPAAAEATAPYDPGVRATGLVPRLRVL